MIPKLNSDELTEVAKTVNSKTFLKQMPLTAAIIKLVKFSLKYEIFYHDGSVNIYVWGELHANVSWSNR